MIHLGILVTLVTTISAGAATAQTPEATNPDVARCAETVSLRLLARGFAGRGVGEVAADRANASIDRWEARFSGKNATRVATLVRVPLVATYRDTKMAPPLVALEARCGFTSGKLLATDVIVPKT